MRKCWGILLATGLCVASMVTGNASVAKAERATITVSDMGDYGKNSAGHISEWKKLSEVVIIPDGEIGIEEDAFPKNAVIKKIILPASMLWLGYDVEDEQNHVKEVFANCTALEEIEVKAENADYLSREGILYRRVGEQCIASVCPTAKAGAVTLDAEAIAVDAKAFKDCKKITAVSVGNKVTRYEADAFMNCTSLSDVPMGTCITYIGNQAFYGCVAVDEVTIGARVGFMGEGAFSCGDNLKKIKVAKGNAKFKVKDGFVVNLKGTKLVLAPNGIEGKVKIPDTITKIGVASFSDCKNLRSVTMNHQIKEIDEYAFANCINLKSVQVSDAMGEIKTGVFSGCKSLEKMVIPKGIHSIMEDAYADCTGLKQLIVPTTVKKYISSCAFTGCNELMLYGEKNSAIEDYATDFSIGFTECLTGPARPSVRARKSKAKVKLYWSRVSKASSYIIYCAKKKDGTFKKIATVNGGSKTSYVRKNIKNARKTYYKVRAVRKSDEKSYMGTYSNPV